MAVNRAPRRKLYREVLGFLIAPLLVPLLYWAATSLFGGFQSLELALYIAQYAYLAAFLGGLPLHVVLSRLGWVSLHDYAVFGVLLGAGAALVAERAPLDFPALLQAGLAAIAGSVASATFRLIAGPNHRKNSAVRTG